MSDGSKDTLTTTVDAQVVEIATDGGISALAGVKTKGEEKKKNNNATSKTTTASKASNASKRRKLNEKGERKPWYCCSCKQTLKPEAFDPGLETCRVCLAKRRSKDRAKKRLRALQLKHH